MTLDECKMELMLLGWDTRVKFATTHIWYDRKLKQIDLTPEIHRHTRLKDDVNKTNIRASTYQYVITQILKEEDNAS